MATSTSSDAPDLPAGDLTTWLRALPAAIAGQLDAEVPCGTCTGCCTSSQFVAIDADEVDALAHIPAELRFPAPGGPPGRVLLGYDERGHCPLLVDGACRIYEHRPRTCRTYDCRVFPAAGLDLDEATKAAIAERARRWRFTYDDDPGGGPVRHAAVRAAAAFVRAHLGTWPPGALPSTTTHQAVLATQLHHLFLAVDPATGALALVDPDPEQVRTAIDALRP
jgi:Fe-S-cluster containining protein